MVSGMMEVVGLVKGGKKLHLAHEPRCLDYLKGTCEL